MCSQVKISVVFSARLPVQVLPRYLTIGTPPPAVSGCQCLQVAGWPYLAAVAVGLPPPRVGVPILPRQISTFQRRNCQDAPWSLPSMWARRLSLADDCNRLGQLSTDSVSNAVFMTLLMLCCHCGLYLNRTVPGKSGVSKKRFIFD